MDCSTERRATMVGPTANLMPSSMRATRIPAMKSVFMPVASMRDHTLGPGTARYGQVATPSRLSMNSADTVRNRSRVILLKECAQVGFEVELCACQGLEDADGFRARSCRTGDGEIPIRRKHCEQRVHHRPGQQR